MIVIRRFVILYLMVMVFSVKLAAQTLEYGVGFGRNAFNVYPHKDEWDSKLTVHQKPGLDLAAFCRLSSSKYIRGLRNIETGFEYYNGSIKAVAWSYTLGAGGVTYTTSVKEKKLSFFLTDYLFNFGTLNKKLQISLGFNMNYTLSSRTVGTYSEGQWFYDSMIHQSHWGTKPINLKYRNAPQMDPFQVNLAFCVAYKSVNFGQWMIKPRVTLLFGLSYEMTPEYYYAFRQRFEIAAVRKISLFTNSKKTSK